MEIKDYISSGKLELYVYGVLPESESAEITKVLREHPEIKAEVDEIEAALVSLSAGAAPKDPEYLLMSIKKKISDKDRQIPVIAKRSHWREYAGWAASILLLIGMFVLYNENQELEKSLRASQVENAQMEERIVEARENAEKTKDLLEVLRDRNIRRIPLPGTEVAPEAYAVAYWNE
ncbi:MAG TPA: anti-sigma factor, partial [Salinimicrobium sp.]|nr:anti-sigma factor [Salinimicrobium sp.]